MAATAGEGTDAIKMWCSINGFGEGIYKNLKEENEFERLEEILELDETELKEMVAEMGLKQGPKMRFKLAVKALALYLWCVEKKIESHFSLLAQEGVTNPNDLAGMDDAALDALAKKMGLKTGKKINFMRICKAMRTPKAKPKAQTKAKAKAQTRRTDDSSSSTDDEKKEEGNYFRGCKAAKDKKGNVIENQFVVPHKVLVLDKEQAMKENPYFEASDFIEPDDIRGVNKSILVVGQTGAGKSTTLNSMVNYLFEVDFKDKRRFKLIQEPPTDERKHQNRVFGYVINAPPALGYTLTVIDTPGFGDTRGIKRDDAAMEEIGHFLERKMSELTAVCFVVKSTDTRVSATQKYIFDKILGIFGKDIADNIVMLFTFADASAPPALARVKECKIPFAGQFKLNNSAFFLSSTGVSEEETAFNSMFYKLGMSSFASFFKKLSGFDDKSLTMTKEALKRRLQLQVKVQGIRKYIQMGMDHLQRLEIQLGVIARAQTMIEQTEGFEIVTTIDEKYKKDITGQHSTVCQSCKWTCDYPCGISDDSRLKGCAAINGDGYCKVCPGQCHWRDHASKSFIYATRKVKKVTRNEQLLERYTNATSQKSQYERVVDSLRSEFETAQVQVFTRIDEVRRCIEEIQQLALRPNVMQNDEYFDLMIADEKQQALKGWQDRVSGLMKLKAQSKHLQGMVQGGYDPFDEVKTRLMRQARTGKVDAAKGDGCLVM